MGLLSCNGTRNYLKGLGYGTIALPRAGIKPMLMLAKSGDRLTRLGPLTGTFLPGDAPLPVVSRERSAPVSGTKSEKIDASIGLDILGTVIGALAGSTLGIKAAYKNARKVAFEFGDVMEDRVDINALDQYLSAGSVAGNVGNFLKEVLKRDEVYVITSTLDAGEISVDASGEHEASLGLEIPVIQQIVGGKIAVSAGGASSTKITYRANDLPLAFGLQVVQLIVDDATGHYTTLKMVKPTPLAGGAVAAAKPRPAVLAPDVPVEL
ncbi:MAG: hypothetical protein ACJ8ER_10550 [Allosphingosinicella sp.]